MASKFVGARKPSHQGFGGRTLPMASQKHGTKDQCLQTPGCSKYCRILWSISGTITCAGTKTTRAEPSCGQEKNGQSSPNEQIWRERHMPRVDKVPDANQMFRIWNYVPPRAGRSRFQESRHQASQSSVSQPSRALQSREQKHWRKLVTTNAGWGGSNSSGQRPPQRGSSSSGTWWPQY